MNLVTVVQGNGYNLELIEICRAEDFNYNKYISSEHKIVGEPKCIEKFKNQFKIKGE